MSDVEQDPDSPKAETEKAPAKTQDQLDMEEKFREIERQAEEEAAERERKKNEPEPLEQEEREVDAKELKRDLKLQYSLSDNDVAELKESFEMFQQDEMLSSHIELGNALRSIRQNPSEQEIKDMWNDSYLTESGGMELYEYIRVVGKRGLKSYADMMEELEEALKVFDKDGSGLIPKDEFRQIMMGMGEPVEKSDADEMFKLVDSTSDGRVICADFVNKLTSK